jgi:hypothetical protein
VTIDELIQSVGVALIGCTSDTCQAPLPQEIGSASGDTGPGSGASLTDWERCAFDTRQSPIDIIGAVVDARPAPGARSA